MSRTKTDNMTKISDCTRSAHFAINTLQFGAGLGAGLSVDVNESPADRVINHHMTLCARRARMYGSVGVM